jgi:hypothetical protein
LEEQSETIITYPWKGTLLDTIRQRPAMYLGEKSLTALWFHLQGYDHARRINGYQGPSEVPGRFADWVGYRLQLGGNFSGFWARAILSRVLDESLALDRFYELREEFTRREERTVATIREERREYTVKKMRMPERDFIECNELLPKSLRIVVYTEDPGFFFEADESESFFYTGWFMPALDGGYMTIPDRFEVVDKATWSRLLAESKRYRRNLNRVRARIQNRERKAHVADNPQS